MKLVVTLFTLSIVAWNLAHGASLPRQQRATKNQVMTFLRDLGTRGLTVTGQHNREPNSDPGLWTRRVRDITGVTPGLWGGDFLFLPDDVQHRNTMIDEAITQWNDGSLVALTWHVCPPTVGETCNWDDSGILAQLSINQWNEIVSTGTNLNNLWKARLDTIVPYLQRLKDEGVIPIFRPIHEMNEGWSWWGGRPGSAGSALLYKITFEHLVNYHGLDNMVWTWCVKDVDMANIEYYWPGDEFVDVASIDMWMKNFPSMDDYNKMLQVARGKPIALGEVGALPTPAVLAQQNQWAWFMVWAEYLVDPSFNTNDGVKETYYLPNTLHQADINIGLL